MPDKLLPQPGDAAAVDFWAEVMAAGSIVAGVGTRALGWLLGAFDDFGPLKPVHFIQALTILGTMCFPCAVTVHYNPDAPEIAVLETSDEMAWQNAWQVWVLFVTPIVLSMIAAVVNAGS